MTSAETRGKMHSLELLALRRISQVSPDARLEHRGPWLLLDAACPEVPVFNQAYTLGSPPSTAALQQAEAWFSGTPFSFKPRSDLDAGIIEHIAQTGYREGPSLGAYLLPGFARPGAARSALVVSQATAPEELDTYGRVGWAASGLPEVGIAIARTARDLGFVLLLGRVEGRPAGCSMAVVSQGLVGIYNLALEPDYRGRGFGTELLQAALAAGWDRGARAAFLTATDDVAGLYTRLGFALAYRYLTFTSPTGPT